MRVRSLSTFVCIEESVSFDMDYRSAIAFVEVLENRCKTIQKTCAGFLPRVESFDVWLQRITKRLQLTVQSFPRRVLAMAYRVDNVNCTDSYTRLLLVHALDIVSRPSAHSYSRRKTSASRVDLQRYLNPARL